MKKPYPSSNTTKVHQQSLPEDIQTKIASYLSRRQRGSASLSRLPRESWKTFLQRVHETHQEKQRLLASLPVYSFLLQEARTVIQNRNPWNPPLTLPVLSVFGEETVDYLRQHPHSRRVMFQVHIRYFESLLCFLLRDLESMYVLLYQGSSPSQNFVEAYVQEQESLEDLKKKTIRAIRQQRLPLVDAFTFPTA